MTNIELLEYAAKAAGIKVDLIKYKNTAVCEGDDNYVELPQDRWYFVVKNTPLVWNPITDDGDALRLAVKLGMSIEVHIDLSQPKPWLRIVYADSRWEHVSPEDYDSDPYAATRKAIVRAAAEIGKNMK